MSLKEGGKQSQGFGCVHRGGLRFIIRDLRGRGRGVTEG